MEKLKAKHDHKLTDILKVAIFGLMLVLPGLILLPSMLYYGVNEYATAPTEQVEKIEYERVNFNQLGKEFTSTNWEPLTEGNLNVTYNDNNAIIIDINYSGAGGDPIGLLQDFYNYGNVLNHKYISRVNYDLIVGNSITLPYLEFAGVDVNYSLVSGNLYENYFTANNLQNGYCILKVGGTKDINDSWSFSNFQIFDLTKMFGVGNEPTLQQFNEWYVEDYYEFTEGRYEILEKPTGTYETYTDITSQIQYNWNSLWQQPLFSWTNYTILKQGLDNFTYVFGITQTSYINNLIAYELIMVAIYIVIDIVLTLFKWLTHLIGEK